MAIFRTSVETTGPLLEAVPVTRTPDAPVNFARWAVREYRLKRVIDVLFSGLAFTVSAPVWLVIAVAIKLEDQGPIFFTQLRWGRGQRPFRVYKFRSMSVTADSRVQALQGDQRITRVGRVLRATSLDELPQILNIWRGDMSWVGPRALPMNEVQQNEAEATPDSAVPGFALRCTVRPGLTGIAQIFAPRDVPRRHKFRYDAFYIQRQSAWLDLRLIAISIWISLRLRWEDRGPKVAWLRRGRRTKGGR